MERHGQSKLKYHKIYKNQTETIKLLSKMLIIKTIDQNPHLTW